MARRKQHQDEELPFVALMDTLTNVVGVLVIVLVLVGLGLARAVNKVLSDLPNVEQKDLEQLKKKITESKPPTDPDKIDKDVSRAKQDAAKLAEQLKTMDVGSDGQKVNITDIEKLREQIEARKKERDAKKSSVEKMLAEIEQLKKSLDTTPNVQPPSALVVRIPLPRLMPEKAEVQRFLVVNNRVLFLNDKEFEKIVDQEIERSGNQIIKSEQFIKGADGKPVKIKDKQGRTVQQKKIIYDQSKLVAHFSRGRVGNREIKLEVLPAPNSPRLPMRLTPTPDGGETVEQIKNPASVFQRLMRKFKSEPNTVVWFHIYKDSLPAYLVARELADQTGVPAGWEIYPNPFYQTTLAEYEVDFIPPKPGPPPPPGLPPAVQIMPPKQTLD
ncbi:MAG: hypothetical protein WCN98_07840 [Verrucomicrobiaceae bacterium]